MIHGVADLDLLLMTLTVIWLCDMDINSVHLLLKSNSCLLLLLLQRPSYSIGSIRLSVISEKFWIVFDGIWDMA